jgi:hypothetical protein
MRSYLSGYSLLLLFGSLMWSLAYYVLYLGTMDASRTIHNKLIMAILGTTFRYGARFPSSGASTESL